MVGVPFLEEIVPSDAGKCKIDPFSAVLRRRDLASRQQILADYPQLEPDDFLGVYAYAAESTRTS
jgi:hypothetical protein